MISALRAGSPNSFRPRTTKASASQPKLSAQSKRHREQGEEDEGHQHERAPAILVGQVRDRDVADHGGDHLEGDQHAELLRVTPPWFIAHRMTKA